MYIGIVNFNAQDLEVDSYRNESVNSFFNILLACDKFSTFLECINEAPFEDFEKQDLEVFKIDNFVGLEEKLEKDINELRKEYTSKVRDLILNKYKGKIKEVNK